MDENKFELICKMEMEMQVEMIRLIAQMWWSF